MNRWIGVALLLAALPVTAHLTGCAAVAVSGIVGGAAVINDRRTTGSQMDDQAIELKVPDLVRAQPDIWDSSHVSTTSFNGIVLLSGETPSESFKERIGKLAAGLPKVRRVHNELAIAAPSSLGARSSDAWITGKVKATLLSEMQLDSTRVKVVTEKGVVYLMGLVTDAEAAKATEFARRVSGVQRVVRLFELIAS